MSTMTIHPTMTGTMRLTRRGRLVVLLSLIHI